MVIYNQMLLGVAVKMPRGGKREGAGRPPVNSGRGKHCIYCTEEELIAVREYLQKLRINVVLKKEAGENG